MDRLRRTVLKAAAAGVLGCWGLMRPLAALALAWNKDAFESKSAADVLKSLGAAGAAESRELAIEAPQIAENGAVVPVEVTSHIANTRSIAVLVEKNPFPLVGQFEFGEGALPFVKVNVKMGASSNVRVVAEAGGRFYTAVKEVKVTIGGCGG